MLGQFSGYSFRFSVFLASHELASINDAAAIFNPRATRQFQAIAGSRRNVGSEKLLTEN
jgi:hypothetical protein